MKNLNSLLVLVIIFFVMLTCQKEDVIEPRIDEVADLRKIEQTSFDQSHENIDLLIASLEKENYENGHYLESVQVSRDGENYLPSFEIQQKLLALMLEQDAENTFLDTFLDTYGLPIWEESFLNLVSDEEVSVMAIPFFKDGEITGVLQFYDLAESSRIFFVSKVTIEQVVNDENYEGDLPSMKTAILNMLIFENNIHNRVYSK